MTKNSNDKRLLNEFLPDPQQAANELQEGSPRGRTLGHLQRLLAAGLALQLTGDIVAGQSTTTTTLKPAEPARGYQVVDPVPPPPFVAASAARQAILKVLEEYRSANERLSAEGVRQVYPSASLTTLRQQFAQYKSLEYAMTGPVFKELDAIVGKAIVEVAVKQVVDRRVDGLETTETTATFAMSRSGRGSTWQIDSVSHRAKTQ